MKNRLLKLVEDAGLKPTITPFTIGDSVEVHLSILEGDKARTQVFAGVVISKRGAGMNEMFTVRRIVQSEGVERTFPVNSPKIAKIEVKRTGVVRRAKLYYLRDRVGKATRLRERKVKTPKPAATPANNAVPEPLAELKRPAAGFLPCSPSPRCPGYAAGSGRAPSAPPPAFCAGSAIASSRATSAATSARST